MTDYLSTSQAATYASCHPETLLEAARKGEVRSSQRAAGCKRRYKPEWLDAWLAGERPKKARTP